MTNFKQDNINIIPAKEVLSIIKFIKKKMFLLIFLPKFFVKDYKQFVDGLCVAFLKEFKKRFDGKTSPYYYCDFREIIPQFTYNNAKKVTKTRKIDCEVLSFWWHISDFYSRYKFLKWLEEKYHNDIFNSKEYILKNVTVYSKYFTLTEQVNIFSKAYNLFKNDIRYQGMCGAVIEAIHHEYPEKSDAFVKETNEKILAKNLHKLLPIMNIKYAIIYSEAKPWLFWWPTGNLASGVDRITFPRFKHFMWIFDVLRIYLIFENENKRRTS